MIYFDSAATTLQKPPSVSRAVAAAITSMTTPGRGDYAPARRAAECVLALRTEAAAFFGLSSPEGVVLTQNATHGLNLAIRSLVKPGGRAVISGYEHNAVTRPLHAIGDVSVKVVNAPLFDAHRMAEGFRKALGEGADAVICTQVSNVFGCELPIAEIAAICREKGVPLVVDASQSAGIVPVEMGKWGAAYAAMPGHKGLYGPQGTGLLLCGEGQMPDSLLQGGTGSLSRQQEMPDFLPDRVEAGTQNIHGAAGLLEGLRFVRKLGTEPIRRHEGRLMGALARGLERGGRFRVFFDHAHPGSVLSVVPVREEVEELAEKLENRGVAVRAGLHCAPLAHLSAGTLDTGTVRFSASAFNTMEEVERVLAMLG